MAYIRRYKTGSGATGIQVCWKQFGRVVRTVQIGSAHSEKGIAKLEREAQKVIEQGQRPLFNLDKYTKK